MPFLSHRNGQPHPHPIRDTLFFVVLLATFTLAVRVFVMEAYVIPTGSMAPTLVGAHRHAACPACGHGFDVDERGTRPLHCPLCHADVPQPAAVLGGDRLLVSKLPVRPHRWDVVVFHNPQERDPLNPLADAPGPNSFFIKRVIGLPGEDLYLLDGHVFVRKPGGEFKIARRADPKENPRWEALARTAWRPVARLKAHSGTWQFDFDTAHKGERPAYDDATLHPYNQPNQGLKHRAEEAVEDLALAATTDGAGGELAFSTDLPGAARLGLALAKDGHLRLLGDVKVLEETRLPAGRSTRLELWLLDNEALAFADGTCVLRHAFDQPWAQVLASPAPPPYPKTIEAHGTLTDIQLDAALPYLPAGHGALARAGRGRLVMGAPVTLPDGSGGPQACWFCAGDNSPASTDSRFWNSIHPRVQEDFLGGHAFEGLVPEALMVGRAWGVAWPVDEDGASWKPQFSRMRRVR